MLRRALVPAFANLRTARPCLPRTGVVVPLRRGYSRDEGNTGSDYKIPDSSTRPADREPLRKVPFSPRSPPPPQPQRPSDAASEPRPFGEDAAQDIDDVSHTVSQAHRRRSQGTGEAESTPEAKEPGDEAAGAHMPLPDLTRGIPSTLDAELRQARAQRGTAPSSLNITEDPTLEDASEERRRGGGGDEIPREQYISSSDRKKNAVFRYMYLVLGLGITGYAAYMGRNWATEEEALAHPEAPSGWGFRRFYDRISARLGSTMSYYRDPMAAKLLPDEDPDPNLRYPFTLVVSLEDMLIHSSWTRERGWQIAKRPGVDYFLRYLSPYFEIVLFTSQPMGIADQVLRKLDPYATIRWPLFREATVYKDGGYVKDISYLNRDLKRVLMIDTDAHHVKHQPENAIILPKWKGDPADRALIDLIPFLEYLATMGFDDVREVLKSFEGTYIPAEFARREQLLRQKFQAAEAEKRKKRPKVNLGGLAAALGLSRPAGDGLQSTDEALGEGKMLWDQIRERGQKQYMEFEKKIQLEGEKWLAERQAEEKKMQEEAMKSFTGGGWFSWGAGGGGGGSGGSQADSTKSA